MIQAFAILACLLLAGLSLFQLGLIAGLPWGRFAWGGGYEVLPMRLRVASATSIVLYVVFALVIAGAAGLVPALHGHRFITAGIWALAAYFLLGTGMNAVSRSKPERLVMTPVAAAMFILCVAVALGS